MQQKFYKEHNFVEYLKLYFIITTKIGGNDGTIVLSRTTRNYNTKNGEGHTLFPA